MKYALSSTNFWRPFSWSSGTRFRRNEMSRTTGFWTLATGSLLLAGGLVACSSVQEQTAAPEPKPAPAQAKSDAASKQPPEMKATKSETTQTKSKAVEVEGVISSVGQRTITFQVERKGK